MIPDEPLGLAIGGFPDNPHFSHGGVDAGFESLLVAYENTGKGAVIMTNAEGGQTLASAILRSIASVYGWPDFHPIARKIVNVIPAVLETYVGVYDLSPTSSLAITLEDGQLIAQATGEEKIPLFPESPTMFFMKTVNAQLEFFPNPDGRISHLILHQDHQKARAERRQ